MIIDSSVLVDLDRGKGVEKLQKLPEGKHSISSAAYMELSTGKYLNNAPDSKFDRIGQNLEVIPIGEEVADKAGEIMADLIESGQRIEINDIYIAATALKYNEKILTANAEHFKRIEGVEVIDWDRL